MKPIPSDYGNQIKSAVAHYWATRSSQKRRQSGAGRSDQGTRSAVTGGKQMDGFCDVITWLLKTVFEGRLTVQRRQALEIPGFFRPTKKWDMLIFSQKTLVAALEFKSQAGPSFGNNFNNRAEEAVGNAQDHWTAFREHAYGSEAPKPWLGWVMLVEDCVDSTKPVSLREPHFPVFDEFRETSYLTRYELLLRKLRSEKLYDGTALLSSRKTDTDGAYGEPASDLSIRNFLAGLVGHAYGIVEGTPQH